MDPEDNEPFDREPWRRLLHAGSGDPPHATDRRILAQARRASVPSAARWWLPASLAASLLLAVLVAHWQLEDTSAPPLVSESDVVPESKSSDERPAPTEPLTERARREPPPSASQLAEPPVATPARARDQAEPAARAAAETVPKAMMSAPAMRTTEQSGVTADAAAVRLTPEEWYARIEALRAEGRVAEADAELARLEAAYPGWLARRRQSKSTPHD